MSSSAWACVLLMCIAAALMGCRAASESERSDSRSLLPPVDERPTIERVLDELHDAASKADEARYFALFDPYGVFLGTDASERWTVEQFRAYAHPYFSKGQGWTYIPRPGKRFISFEIPRRSDSRTAWFDEVLDNAKYGECRGSGVLAKNESGEWKITQYNLTVPVPNGLLPKVVEMIRAEGK